MADVCMSFMGIGTVCLAIKESCVEPCRVPHSGAAENLSVISYLRLLHFLCVLTVLMMLTMQDLIALKADLQMQKLARELKWASGQRGDQRYDAPTAQHPDAVAIEYAVAVAKPFCDFHRKMCDVCTLPQMVCRRRPNTIERIQASVRNSCYKVRGNPQVLLTCNLPFPIPPFDHLRDCQKSCAATVMLINPDEQIML